MSAASVLEENLEAIAKERNSALAMLEINDLYVKKSEADMAEMLSLCEKDDRETMTAIEDRMEAFHQYKKNRTDMEDEINERFNKREKEAREEYEATLEQEKEEEQKEESEEE